MKKSLIGLAMAGLIGLGIVAVPAEAGSASTGTITVTGTGSVTLKRDQATTNLSVTALADKAADAMSQATASYNAVRKAILDLGINADNLTTSGVSLYPEWDYSTTANGGKAVLRGYRVYLSVQVQSTIMNSAKVLDVAVTTGGDAVSINGISFDVANPDAVSDVSRTRAVADAKNKAKDYAGALAQHVGRAIKIVETGAAVPTPIYRMMDKAATSGTIEVDPGTEKVSSSVSITFELLD